MRFDVEDLKWREQRPNRRSDFWYPWIRVRTFILLDLQNTSHLMAQVRLFKSVALGLSRAFISIPLKTWVIE